LQLAVSTDELDAVDKDIKDDALKSSIAQNLGAAVVQVILLVLLVPRFAATGAAIAYAVSMCGMYLVFAKTAHRKLVVLSSSA
jgi:O-antigen/teichoic acid export membrane protein